MREVFPRMSPSKWVEDYTHCRSTNLRMALWVAAESTEECALSFS